LRAKYDLHSTMYLFQPITAIASIT